VERVRLKSKVKYLFLTHPQGCHKVKAWTEASIKVNDVHIDSFMTVLLVS